MTPARHTPGPWRTRDGFVETEAGDIVKYHSPWIEAAWDGNAEADANTRLMASAPALLEALREFIEFLNDGTPESDRSPHERRVLAQGFAALALAEGGA